jgi:hypothetical protein
VAAAAQPLAHGSPRRAIAELVVEALESLDLEFPKASNEHLQALAEARQTSRRRRVKT